ncbi:hypothetical protein [Castellaniella sp. S9]|uniref:hypothetical protein n=1 Tax=Castellaniella sp. S9 TaxID=2993652 RepID=UPI0022B581D4|nr:hypothetical protein [Castellaniella sp. S9]
MIIDDEVKRYLLGTEISNGKRFKINRTDLFCRNDIYKEISKGKRVLHMGCADHIALIEEKRKKGTYLHDLIVESAHLAVGADINLVALQKMKNLGIENLYHINDIPSNIKFDLVVVPDVIEHISNVGKFLVDLDKYNCPIAISTPNAYRFSNRLQLLSETVNTDHKYWFSPYTLAKTIYEAGYKVNKFYYTDTLNIRRPISSAIKWWFPLVRDGLLFMIEKNSEKSEKTVLHKK